MAVIVFAAGSITYPAGPVTSITWVPLLAMLTGPDALPIVPICSTAPADETR